MALFDWGRSSEPASSKNAAPDAPGGRSGPLQMLRALDAAVPLYLDKVDQGELIYPACKRTLTDPDGDIRSIWEHTRLEAIRYIVMVPGRDEELLIEPARQPEMIDAFLRLQPHDKTVVDFTGSSINDFGIAITAGLNWLNHCAVSAGVDRAKFSGTLRNFRKIAVVAQQWWALEGADARCAEMLLAEQKPPLMFYLMWLEYTRLSKEIASAAFFGPAIDTTIENRRKSLEKEFAGRPVELSVALDELTDTMACFEDASDPDALLE